MQEKRERERISRELATLISDFTYGETPANKRIEEILSLCWDTIDWEIIKNGLPGGISEEFYLAFYPYFVSGKSLDRTCWKILIESALGYKNASAQFNVARAVKKHGYHSRTVIYFLDNANDDSIKTCAIVCENLFYLLLAYPTIDREIVNDIEKRGGEVSNALATKCLLKNMNAMKSPIKFLREICWRVKYVRALYAVLERALRMLEHGDYEGFSIKIADRQIFLKACSEMGREFIALREKFVPYLKNLGEKDRAVVARCLKLEGASH